MCLLQVSHWWSRSHWLSWQGNEGAKPAEPFPRGSWKEWAWTAASLPGTERRWDVQRAVASAAAGVLRLGGHSSANTYSQDMATESIPCLATTLTHKPNQQTEGQETGRPRYQGRAFNTLLSFPQSPSNRWPPQNACSIMTFVSQTGGKGIHSPSWATLVRTYLIRHNGTCNSLERVTWCKRTYSLIAHLLNAHSVPDTVLGAGDTAMSQNAQGLLLWWAVEAFHISK